jgi:hypothetical protein
VDLRVLSACAILALAACGEPPAARSICDVAPEASDFHLRRQADDDPEKTTYADRSRAEGPMTYFRDNYEHCWERVANEVISMGGADTAAKAQADDYCKRALPAFRDASAYYHRIERDLHLGDDGGNAEDDADRDVAEVVKSLNLRLETFKLCHAHRAQSKP